MLEQEEQKTGKRIFKRGNELRHGLIDVKGVLDTLSLSESSDRLNNRACSEKHAWRKALKIMQRNPQLMLDAVPSIWEDHFFNK